MEQKEEASISSADAARISQNSKEKIQTLFQQIQLLLGKYKLIFRIIQLELCLNDEGKGQIILNLILSQNLMKSVSWSR